MGSVVAFSKQKTDGKYVIKICTVDPNACDVQTGYYKIENTKPKDWFFAFPSTQDNANVFIPSRIIEDHHAFQSLVLSTLPNGPTCLKIDPCDNFSSMWCCNTQVASENNNSDATITVSSSGSSTKLKTSKMLTVWFITLLVLFGISLILVFVLVATN